MTKIKVLVDDSTTVIRSSKFPWLNGKTFKYGYAFYSK